MPYRLKYNDNNKPIKSVSVIKTNVFYKGNYSDHCIGSISNNEFKPSKSGFSAKLANGLMNDKYLYTLIQKANTLIDNLNK